MILYLKIFGCWLAISIYPVRISYVIVIKVGFVFVSNVSWKGQV